MISGRPHGCLIDGDDLPCDRDAASRAKFGSTVLLERIQNAYAHFAFRHGVSLDEARILLLDTGVRL